MADQDLADDDYARKLREMDRVLNDPDVPMQPALVWRLLAELSEHHKRAGTMPPATGAPATRVPDRAGRARRGKMTASRNTHSLT